jgi:hypothetical protein
MLEVCSCLYCGRDFQVTNIEGGYGCYWVTCPYCDASHDLLVGSDGLLEPKDGMLEVRYYGNHRTELRKAEVYQVRRSL